MKIILLYIMESKKVCGAIKMTTEQSVFTPPEKDGYTVYTKSDCKFCTNVKSMLFFCNPEPVIINCDAYLLDCKEEFLQFMDNLTGKSHRTFPMVFHKGEFIGGFRETQEYFDTLDAFSYMNNF